jgi:two-component system, chemotaxis family, CheB/CheR fusion protein
LLKALPLDTGMGFVLVQHLDPDHKSQLTEILSRVTELPVSEITDDELVKPDHVYIIPRDTNLTIASGVLKIRPRERTRSPHRPIDAFFESLAQDRREGAVGVVLSGTATDGTLGLEAIKAEGGITFAQDDSARYDSMPRSAVGAGCVDLVMSPAAIGKELARIAKHPYVAARSLLFPAEGDTSAENARAPETEQPTTPEREDGQDSYKKILLLLRDHSGVDFSLYKSTTIQRRISRRLMLNKQNTPDGYARFLRGNGKELDSLYSDVLISVTSFFRNPETFEVLERRVLPELLKQRGDEPLRCWVLGCSTGQEAYSIAMAFSEAAEKTPGARSLQIFATDLNASLLDKARRGLYAKSVADDISPQRLRRFFVEEDGGYRIIKPLREMVVFARQNLIADPPFSRLDLVSCRNLLIYLEPSLQKKAIPTFHYALKPGGFLLLGASESISGYGDLFEPVDKKHKIYSKKPASMRPLHLPISKERDELSNARPLPKYHSIGQEIPEGSHELNAQREADRVIVNQFAPPAVLVNAQLKVLQFRGPTGAFLEPPIGKASFDVLKMARDGLMLPLRSAINQAIRENRTATKANVRVKRGGATRSIDLEVIPLKNLRERCFLIVFRDGGGANGKNALPEPRPARPRGLAGREERRRIAELERELSELREYYESMQEQHDAANEEVQSAHEEVQSANEELQSINEELETSKEELESSNEELTTVNEEMSNRNVELNRLTDDLVNLQASTKLAVVLFGRDLTIRRFSQQAEREFELVVADIGRRIGHLRHGLVEARPPPASDANGRKRSSAPPQSPLDLEQLVSDVISEGREQEREVMDKSRRWRSLRVRPYMTVDNKVDGAVLVLVDIDTLKRSELSVAAMRDYAENTVDAVREPLLVLDSELRVESANSSFYRVFGSTPAETIGKLIYDLDGRQLDVPRLRATLAGITSQNPSVDGVEVETESTSLGRRSMLINARRIPDPERENPRILVAIEDVTERKRLQESLRKYGADLLDASARKNEFLAMLGHELRNPLSALVQGLELLGRLPDGRPRAEELRGMMIRQTKRMTVVLNQLLDLARVISGKIELSSARIDLTDTVRAAIETVRPLFDAHRHELVTSLPADGTACVLGDAVRLSQVTENLLTNAAKYTNDGGRIELAVEADEAEARIIVRDTGTGISAEFLPHVFEVFAQSPRTLDRSKGGLGLGLPLVRHLVEMHGGKVLVASPGLGQGSEFVVKLPRVHERRATERVERPASSVARGKVRGRRILVVDDESGMAEVIAELLEHDGHQALAVNDGPSAIEAVRTFGPEVVLLDIGLPGMDGYDVARRLREEHGDKRLLLFAVTGYQSDAARLKKAGFDGHLLKPPNLQELFASLASLDGELSPERLRAP